MQKLGIDVNYDNLMRKIINLYQSKGLEFKDKHYYKSYFQSIIETELIEKMQNAFKEESEQGFDLITFVRQFLNIIPHNQDETLYLIMCVIDLFQVISEDSKNNQYITYQDFLNYVTENFFLEKKAGNDYVLQQRAIPQKRIFNPDVNRVRNIDIETPIYYGKSDDQIRRLVKSKLITDSSHHATPIKQGLYASEVKLIFTLDGLSDKLNAYDLNCKLVKQISPANGTGANKKETIIMSFAWSNRQLRIGATLKELSLIFWDSSDKFKYEKKILISHLVTEHQTQIWFIEFMNMWVTADHAFSIYGWNIEKETTNFRIQKRLKNQIIDIVELPYIKKVAIGCLDKTLQIWNLIDSQLLMTIDFPQGGIHGIVFNEPYQVILTAGYENSINIIQIDFQNKEHNFVGKLTGHSSMVTTVQCIDKTPMIVSCDDCGIIKVWDIRKLNCIQTIVMESKNQIMKILDIQRNLKIGFIGQRVLLMEWDQELAQVNENNSSHPIMVEFSQKNQNIIVCTQKEVKLIDLLNGRTQKIYSGLLQSSSDDISIFKSTGKFKNFVVGDHRGHLKVYNYQSGQYLKSLKPHSNEVSELHIDFQNQLFVSAGWDSHVYIQKEEKHGFQVLREISNCFNTHKINILELSVNFNIFAISSNVNKVYIFDYEFCKLIQCIDLAHENENPTAINIMNDFQIILICSDKNMLYIIHFINNQNGTMDCTTLATINLADSSDKLFNPKTNYNSNFVVVQTQFDSQNINLTSCIVYLALLSGSICSFDVLDIFQSHGIQKLSNHKVNFNPLRVFKENFQKQIEKQKINEFRVDQCQKQYHKLNEFKAHKQKITSFQIIQLNNQKILTSSIDFHICIWSLDGQLEAKLNINHPLPIKWNVKIDQYKQVSKNILFALKLIETLVQKFQLSQKEQQKISNINNMLKQLNDDQCFPTEIYFDQEQNKKYLIHDEYTQKDLQFDQYKQLLQKEKIGPSLKDMEFNKRLIKYDIQVSEEKKTEPQKIKNISSNINMDYFSQNYRSELAMENDQKTKPAYCEQTNQLAYKLDNAFKNLQKNENISKDERKTLKKIKPVTNKKSIYLIKELQGQQIEKQIPTTQRQIEQTYQSISTIDKFGSFFDYANQKIMMDQNQKISKSINQIHDNKFHEKKQFNKILKNIDQKLKTAQQKFKNNPVEYSVRERTKSQINSLNQEKDLKQIEATQRKTIKQDMEFKQKINKQLDNVVQKAKIQGQMNYQQKQEMRKVLDKIAITNQCSIEDTMWLYQQREKIQNNQNQFIKNANIEILEGINMPKTKRQDHFNNSKILIADSKDETQDNILSFLKD